MLPATMIPHEEAQKIAEAVRWFGEGGALGNASSGAADHETVTASFLSEEVSIAFMCFKFACCCVYSSPTSALHSDV